MEERFDVIVIGGGPGGAILATLMAREGRRVLVLERHRFPRFHIGESVTAFGAALFRDLGVYDELKEVNYVKKKGLEFVLPDVSKPLWFPDRDRNEPDELPWAFQMVRSKMDEVLLRNARRKSADVREEHRVKNVLFEGERAVGVEFQDLSAGARPDLRLARAPWIVDASGQAGVLNRQLGDNCFNDHLHEKKVAVFGHWRGDLGITNADDEINFKLCVHRNGRDWAWYLPVDRDLVSLGVVLTRETVKNRRGTLDELFHETARDMGFLGGFLRDTQLEQQGELRTIKDYSYRCRRTSGPGWALVGDSAGFIDPIFSTGLQITFNSAYRLRDVIEGTLADPAREPALRAWYDSELDRFFRVNSTLVHLFYTAQLDFRNYESGWYMWKHIPFASPWQRLRYLWKAGKLLFVGEEEAKQMAEEVVFGNPQPGNKVAELFLALSHNFDRVYERELAARAPRLEYAEAEA